VRALDERNRSVLFRRAGYQDELPNCLSALAGHGQEFQTMTPMLVSTPVIGS